LQDDAFPRLHPGKQAARALYVGVTNSLGKRIVEHREGRGSQFVFQYKVFPLVYAETFDDPLDAIAAEKRIKRWRRQWKIELIEKGNPEWIDLTPFIHWAAQKTRSSRKPRHAAIRDP